MFDHPNCDYPVTLHSPVHGDVCDQPVPWHLLCPIEPPRQSQENIQHNAKIQHSTVLLGMQLAELCFIWQPIDPFWCQPINLLELQEDIVQLAELIRCCNI